MVCDLDELLPALSRDGWMREADSEIFARYWNERQSEAHNLEMIGYWLALRRDGGEARDSGEVRGKSPEPTD